MRRLVMGDVHGNYRAIMQVLRASEFDYDNDLLIFLGDVADGWSQTRECVDELLKIKNLKAIAGNHDFWTSEWMICGVGRSEWMNQGGFATIRSYKNSIPKKHVKFFKGLLPYVVLDDDKLFVHGGFTSDVPIEQQHTEHLMWDRDLYYNLKHFIDKGISAKRLRGQYNEVYIGHTNTEYLYKTDKPVMYDGVHLLDTGAGWDGKLTIMDIDTKEYWQSDLAEELYPDERGRR